MKKVRMPLFLFMAGLLVITSCSSTASVTTTPQAKQTSDTTQNALTTTPITPAVTPVTSPSTAKPSDLPLQIISVTSPVSTGADATLNAQTVNGAECKIAVYYESGQSTASGLSTKTADDNGRVSWTWKVGAKTNAGSWRIVVTATYEGNSASQTTYFEVK